MKTLLFAMLLALCLSSCMTFEKAFRKYGHNRIDTTFTTVRTAIPHDSAVLRVVTDTTTVVREIRQGRARIIYERNPQTTYIRADCDSVIVEKKVPQYINRQVWGVDPVYKANAERWQTIAFVLMGLIGTAVIAYVFTYQLKISKR